MKPTYGAVSRYGMIAFASSLDQAGPFTRDVTDAALLLGAMVGEDPRDSTSIGLPEPIALPSATDLQGIRIGVPEELTGEGIEPGVLEAFNATLDLARELGATVETMRLPHAPHALAAYYILAPAEASSNLARYDGVRYGLRADGDGDLLSMYTATREAGFGAEVKRRIMLGTYALSSGYYDAYYGRAQKVRTRISRGLQGRLGVVRLRGDADQPVGRLRARRQARGPARDVPQRRLRGPDEPRRHPGDLDPQRALGGPADRLPARRPGVQREPHPRRRARAREGDRLRRLEGEDRHEPQATGSPSSGWRSTSSSRRTRRCSAAAS